MPHLDFREALSTPEEKIFSPAVSVAAVASNVAAIPSMTDFLRGLRLSRATWANIVFVAIASIGGMVCAFYFFNGVEVLRAAASWPAEYLYPRPVFEERIFAAELPTPVDRFGATADEPESSTPGDAKSIAQTNSAPAELAPFNTTIGTTTPPTIITEPPPVVFPPVVPPPPTSLPLTNRANTMANGADTFVQALIQDPTGTASNTVTTAPGRADKSAKKTTTVVKRKISKTPQKVVSEANSTANETQMSVSTVPPVNQMMTGGGLGGGGSIGAIGGGGMGAAGGAGAGTVGGAAGGLGGLNSGGLGGTISGVGGTVGGVIGKH